MNGNHKRNTNTLVLLEKKVRRGGGVSCSNLIRIPPSTHPAYLILPLQMGIQPVSVAGLKNSNGNLALDSSLDL